MRKRIFSPLFVFFLFFWSFAWAICPVFGPDIILLQWSKDGNAALLCGNFFNGKEFIVVDGVSGKVNEFPFHVVRMGQDPNQESNDLSPGECSDQMDKLASLLQERGFRLAPELKKACRTGPLKELHTKRQVGSLTDVDWPLFERLEQIAGIGGSREYSSPGGLLSFEVTQPPVCATGRVLMFAKKVELRLAKNNFIEGPIETRHIHDSSVHSQTKQPASHRRRVDLLEEQNAKSGPHPIPEEWKSCVTDSDCVPALAECWSWIAVNQRFLGPYKGPLDGHLLPYPYSKGCRDPIDPGAQPKVFCRTGKCQESPDPGAFSPNLDRLFFAIDYRKTDEAIALVNQGVDPNGKRKNGETPLLAALRSCSPDVSRLAAALIQHGASLSQRDKEGNTPLMQINSGCPGAKELVAMFLKNGADPNTKNKSGKTPAEHFKHDKRIYKILLNEGAKDVRAACDTLIDACIDAGFTQEGSGGHPGDRTFPDCYEPALSGKSPENVKVDQAVISECRKQEETQAD